jgi:hypothetical protein
MRLERISRAGTTYSVARSTSKIVASGPSTASASTNASSTSMRTLENRPCSITAPFSNTMSAKIAP